MAHPCTSYPCHLGRSALRSLALTASATATATAAVTARTATRPLAAANAPYTPSSHRRLSVSASPRIDRDRDHARARDHLRDHARSKRSTIPPDALQLKSDQLDAAPTLEYLDSLRPAASRRLSPRSSQRDQSKDTDAQYDDDGGDANRPPVLRLTDAQGARLWTKTRDAISASFTRDQLLRLAKEAGLKGSYSTKVKKDDLVRRILVQRFGLEDVAERLERLRNEERQKVNLFLAFPPAHLFLLLSAGPAAVRSEAARRNVVILPQAQQQQQQEGEQQQSQSPALGFSVRGKPADTLSMRQWADDFRKTVSEKQERIQLPPTANGDGAGDDVQLSAAVIRFISRSSRCFIEVLPSSSSTALDVRLQYLDESDADRATLMLRRHVAERAAASQRLGAGVYTDDVMALRQYALLPFAPAQPLPWISQVQDAARSGSGSGAGAAAPLSFRASLVPDLDTLGAASSSSSSAVSRSRRHQSGDALGDSATAAGEADADDGMSDEPHRLRIWDARGEIEAHEPFEALRDLCVRRRRARARPDDGDVVGAVDEAGQGDDTAAAPAMMRYTATLGHIVHHSRSDAASAADADAVAEGEDGDASAVLDPLGNPRPGLWPFPHLLDHLVPSSRGPPSPSSSLSNQEGQRTFLPAVPASLLSSSSAAMEGMGWDAKSREVRRYTSLVYQDVVGADAPGTGAGRGRVEIVVHEHDEKGKIEVRPGGGDGAETRAEMEMMLPESDVDLLLALSPSSSSSLSSASFSPSAWSSPKAGEMPPHSRLPSDYHRTPPTRIQFRPDQAQAQAGEREMVLSSQRRVIRSSFSPLDPLAPSSTPPSFVEVDVKTGQDVTLTEDEPSKEQIDARPTLHIDQISEFGTISTLVSVEWSRPAASPAPSWDEVRRLVLPLVDSASPSHRGAASTTARGFRS